ncbi:MAG: hypothetical protein IPO25_05085 [Saprospiraceae bacterium]|nr:hypothetical protein [Saprospiraceae bacterium]
MKKIFAYLVILNFITACAQTDSKKELLNSIVDDPIYYEYQQTLSQNAINIATAVYDMEAIKNLVIKLNVNTLDATLLDYFVPIKGGVDYLNLTIKMDQLFSKLVENHTILKNIRPDDGLELWKMFDHKYGFSKKTNQMIMDNVKSKN